MTSHRCFFNNVTGLPVRENSSIMVCNRAAYKHNQAAYKHNRITHKHLYNITLRLLIALISMAWTTVGVMAVERVADRTYDFTDASLWSTVGDNDCFTYLPTDEQLYTCGNLPSGGSTTISSNGLELPRYERKVASVTLTMMSYTTSSLRVYWFQPDGSYKVISSNTPINVDENNRMAVDITLDQSWITDGGYLSIRPRNHDIQLTRVDVYFEGGVVSPIDPTEAYVTFVPEASEQPDGTMVSVTLAQQYADKGYTLTVNDMPDNEFTLHFTDSNTDFTVEYQVSDAGGHVVETDARHYTWATVEAPSISHGKAPVPSTIQLFEALTVSGPADADLDLTVSYVSDAPHKYTRHIPAGNTPRVRMFEPDALGHDVTVSATAYTDRFRPATTTVTTHLSDDYTSVTARAVIDTPDNNIYTSGDKVTYHIETQDNYHWNPITLQHPLAPWCYAKIYDNTEFCPFFDYYDLYTEPMYLLLDRSCQIQFIGRIAKATDHDNGQFYHCALTLDTANDNNNAVTFSPVTDNSDIMAAQLKPTDHDDGMRTFLNHYIVTGTDEYGNLYAMTTVGNDSYTGLDGIRIADSTSVDINISTGHNAAWLTLFASDNGPESGPGSYLAGWSNDYTVSDPTLTYSQAAYSWISAKNTHMLTYASFDHTDRSATTKDNETSPITISPDRISFGDKHPGHEIVFSRDTRVFECSCTSPAYARSPIHIAANLHDSYNDLNTSISSVTDDTTTTHHASATAWYTIQGIALPSSPTAPGIYIRVGRDGHPTLQLVR